jgi:hypothetical protein
VQCNCKQQDGWFQGFDVVALRRHRDQITWTDLGLHVTRTDADTTPHAQQRGVPRTLVLTHHPARGKRHERLPETGTGPAVDRDRTASTVGGQCLRKLLSCQFLDRRDIHPSMIARQESERLRPAHGGELFDLLPATVDGVPGVPRVVEYGNNRRVLLSVYRPMPVLVRSTHRRTRHTFPVELLNDRLPPPPIQMPVEDPPHDGGRELMVARTATVALQLPSSDADAARHPPRHTRTADARPDAAHQSAPPSRPEPDAAHVAARTSTTHP